MFKKQYLLFAFCLLSICFVQAQELKFSSMDKSPMDAAHYPRTSAYNNYMDEADKKSQQIKVLYCRPNKKDRVIFGELVPFGKEWRLGANEATEVTFYQAVEIGGQFIQRGTYTMFADIYPSQWIIKISSERFIGGNSNRDTSKDVAIAAIPTTDLADVREAFTIGFQKVDADHCNMVFEWDRTRAVLPISFNPVYLSGDDKSPMDLVQYPNMSRLRNFLKPEELADNEAKIRVVYSRPQKNDREIFGKLVKFGEYWRVGANETTEITFFENVKIGDTDVRSGRYGMFAKVEKDTWEIVIHKNIPSWGAYSHDDEMNVASIKVPVEKTPETLEALSITFDKKSDNEVHMVIGWDDSMVRVPVMMK